MNRRMRVAGKGQVELQSGISQNIVTWTFQGTSKGEAIFSTYAKALEFYLKMERFLVYEPGGGTNVRAKMAV